jgi:hypothetical protein
VYLKKFSGGYAPGPPEEREGRGREGKGREEKGGQREGEKGGRQRRKEGKGIRVGREGIGPPQCLTQIDAPASGGYTRTSFKTGRGYAYVGWGGGWGRGGRRGKGEGGRSYMPNDFQFHRAAPDHGTMR